MHPDSIAPQFNDPTQQRNAATLGMWIFLATEVLFFGGLFLAYTVYRNIYPAGFAEGSNHTLLTLGTVNTALLLVSSFTMVLAVRAAALRRLDYVAVFLALTAVLGTAFLVIKSFEYRQEIHEGLLPGKIFLFAGPQAKAIELFFLLYFIMTGVHALHVGIGVLLLSYFTLRTIWQASNERFATSIDLLGLYWHFVDIIWVFLFPLVYLLGRST
jgi:cytochrome c oxidase subunit 3